MKNKSDIMLEIKFLKNVAQNTAFPKTKTYSTPGANLLPFKYCMPFTKLVNFVVFCYDSFLRITSLSVFYFKHLNFNLRHHLNLVEHWPLEGRRD